MLPAVILFEEPDHGLHPKRMKEVMDILRELTQPRPDGRPGTQVILTTHSPYLLDFVDLEQDQILVFQRDMEKSCCTVHEADREKLKQFLDDFLLGDIWYNRGEEGMIKR